LEGRGGPIGWQSLDGIQYQIEIRYPSGARSGKRGRQTGEVRAPGAACVFSPRPQTCWIAAGGSCEEEVGGGRSQKTQGDDVRLRRHYSLPQAQPAGWGVFRRQDPSQTPPSPSLPNKPRPITGPPKPTPEEPANYCPTRGVVGGGGGGGGGRAAHRESRPQATHGASRYRIANDVGEGRGVALMQGWVSTQAANAHRPYPFRTLQGEKVSAVRRANNHRSSDLSVQTAGIAVVGRCWGGGGGWGGGAAAGKRGPAPVRGGTDSRHDPPTTNIRIMASAHTQAPPGQIQRGAVILAL